MHGKEEDAPPVPAELPSDIEVTVPWVCMSQGTLVSWDKNGMGARATWELEVGHIEAAASLLEGYRQAGEVSLVYSGALDLLGRLWGCVVVSNDAGWAELAFADGRQAAEGGGADGEGGSACVVTVVRLG